MNPRDLLQTLNPSWKPATKEKPVKADPPSRTPEPSRARQILAPVQALYTAHAGLMCAARLNQLPAGPLLLPGGRVCQDPAQAVRSIEKELRAITARVFTRPRELTARERDFTEAAGEALATVSEAWVWEPGEEEAATLEVATTPGAMAAYMAQEFGPGRNYWKQSEATPREVRQGVLELAA